MKTWEMLKISIEGNVWKSEALGYSLYHTERGMVTVNSKSSIKLSARLIRVNDWEKVK